MSMAEPHPGVLTSAGFQSKENAGPSGLSGIPYQHYNVGLEAHPGELFTQGPRTTPAASSLITQPPEMRNLSSRQFGNARPSMEQAGEEEG